MEFSLTHVATLNMILPSKHKPELKGKSEKDEKPMPASSPDFQLPEKRPVGETPASKSLTEASKVQMRVLSELKKHRSFTSFKEIKLKDLNFAQIESKIQKNEYSTLHDFSMDIRKIWSESFAASVGNQDAYSTVVELSVLFEQVVQSSQNPSKQVKSEKSDFAKKVSEKPLGITEKKILCANIRKLEPKYYKGVRDIVKESMNVKGKELEFDINTLPAKVSRDLDKYVKQCLNYSSKAKKKNTVEEIKNSQKETKLKLEKLENSRNKIEEKEERKVSEAESSSTSESEEEMPNELSQNGGGFIGKVMDFNKIS